MSETGLVMDLFGKHEIEVLNNQNQELRVSLQEVQEIIKQKSNHIRTLEHQQEKQDNQIQNLQNQLNTVSKKLLKHPQHIALMDENKKLSILLTQMVAEASKMKKEKESLSAELSKAQSVKSFNAFAKCPFCDDYKVPFDIERNSEITVFSFLKEHIAESHFYNLEISNHDIAHFLCMCERSQPEGKDINAM